MVKVTRELRESMVTKVIQNPGPISWKLFTKRNSFQNSKAADTVANKVKALVVLLHALAEKKTNQGMLKPTRQCWL